MNIQARNLQSRKVRTRTDHKNNFVNRMFTLFNIIMLLGAIFAIMNYRISLGQKITNIERESTVLKRNIHMMDREIEALRIRKEKLSSWENIRNKIVAYQLPLIPPKPEQVKTLVMRDISSIMTREPQLATNGHKQLASNRNN